MPKQLNYQIIQVGSANYLYMPNSQAFSPQNWNCWENQCYEIKWYMDKLIMHFFIEAENACTIGDLAHCKV